MSRLTRSKRRKQASESQSIEPPQFAVLEALTICSLHYYEILADIFQRVLENTAPAETDQDDLVSPMVVCKHWRAVALSTLRLWSTLAVDVLGRGAQEQDDIIDAASYGFPGRRLVYVFIRGWDVPFVNQHGKIPGQPESHDLQELWEYFAGLSNLAFLRLCGLELIHFRDWFLQPVTSLSQLIIDVSKAPASIPSARDMMYTDYDNTQVAIGNNISIMRSAAISNAVDQLHRLKSLTLHVYVASSFVLSLLEESPLLESFDLDLHPKGYRTIQDNSDPTLKRVRANAVVLSHLRDLKLAHITEQEQVLEYMRAPRLRKLCDAAAAEPPWVFFSNNRGFSFFPNNNPPADARLDDRNLLEFLRVYPNVQSLTMDRLDCVTGSAFDDLQLLEYSSLLAKLRNLHISGNWKTFSQDALVRFIRMRGKKGFVKARGGGSGDGEGGGAAQRTLEWAYFRDWLYPELFVRYDAFDCSAKLLRVEEVDLYNRTYVV
ncbi:hypothetical protein FA13DRAFT_1818592 [Coprinellus micaceus]|uniref:Uncharacterized protein n=1 Tax=Coprinellus micaceus TaxID=71717 RepID=A0A4Y7SNI3_COPMI|nr:hypothetical protein FA13DRAFT_1818592 [Coprinellus micaceus]